MKLTQCENGHFYDAEKYSFCPYCNNGAGAPNPGQGSSFQSQGDDVTHPFESMGYGSIPGSSPTVGFTDQTVPLQQAQPGAQQNNVQYGSAGMVVTQPGPSRSSAQDDGKTVAYMAWNSPASGEKTESFFAPGSAASRPVVGWLVCVDGSSYGKCFNLYGEKNFIGRSADMDVALTDDNTVARNKHAVLIYDPKTKTFYAQPGESHELFYVNDKVVLQSIVLEDRDVLTIGKTSLVFVPFCDDRYSWTKV